MESYAACSQAEEGGKERETGPTIPKPKSSCGPIFLENPDGTITEAIPSNYKEPKSKTGLRSMHRTAAYTGDDSDASSGNLSETAAGNMYQEVDFLYSRHERVLLLLLFTQAFLEVLYDVVYIMRMTDGSSVAEFMAMYTWRVTPKATEALFWVIFFMQVGYSLLYYIMAAVAMWTKRPKNYRLFANLSIVGIVGLILLAYVDKFNLIIFFLHLLSYIYARFLQGLTASLLLLPPGPSA